MLSTGGEGEGTEGWINSYLLYNPLERVMKTHRLLVNIFFGGNNGCKEAGNQKERGCKTNYSLSVLSITSC